MSAVEVIGLCVSALTRIMELIHQGRSAANIAQHIAALGSASTTLDADVDRAARGVVPTTPPESSGYPLSVPWPTDSERGVRAPVRDPK